MSTQSMVPCISGKCGVREHILGSQEQKACSGFSSTKAAAPVLASAPVQKTTGKTPNHELAARAYLNDSYKHEQAVQKRFDTEAGRPTGNPVRDFIFRLRSSPAKRKQIAAAQYRESHTYSRASQSYLNLLETAQDARETDRGGEFVKDMSNFRDRAAASSYSRVQYYHGKGNHPVIAAIQQTPAGPRHVKIRYERNMIHLEAVDPITRETRATEIYDSGNSISNPGTTGAKNDHRYERTQSLTDLLIHAQNENNWK